MKVADIMTTDVFLTAPNRSIREAAETMHRMDVGSLPVGDGDRLVGMVTDRDITIRAVARGMAADTPVRDVMTQDIRYCFEDEDVDDVARNMADLKVRRLPVINRDKRLVGFVSLADFAHGADDSASEELLKGVATPH
ncbi:MULTISPECIES: CBS domain-containing protein [unclassified Lysobacter]|uniref:CBS domain-containing protein n=1 Tax=unclassified Lysobacter TaxID=2635362 RepID=UPI001C23EB22|nr:CBS domain-containing protein [Lysobacter sp. MMG2]MBU8977985.1 CBS domain-containing protein [Lysobacter sp. MMG2]